MKEIWKETVYFNQHGRLRSGSFFLVQIAVLPQAPVRLLRLGTIGCLLVRTWASWGQRGFRCTDSGAGVKKSVTWPNVWKMWPPKLMCTSRLFPISTSENIKIYSAHQIQNIWTIIFMIKNVECQSSLLQKEAMAKLKWGSLERRGSLPFTYYSTLVEGVLQHCHGLFLLIWFW